jgi:nitroreductase
MTASNELIIQQLNWRYAVKQFDKNRRIDDPTWRVLEQALVLSPSSYGLQPWRFIVIADAQLKSQLTAISWNQPQPADCSHMVVLAAKEKLDMDYVDQHIQRMAKVKSVAPESLAGYRKMLASTVQGSDSHLDWNSRQVYLALGQLMTAAALMGVDACPMEGIQTDAYDQLLGLAGTGYRSVVGCALGYRDASDKAASAKKLRFSVDEVVQRL